MTRHLLRTLRNQRTIVVRNSLLSDNSKEALSSQKEGIFKWYSCGPTVYDDAHLGHARSYVSFDILRRIMSSQTGVNLDYALGITDIDDKIINRAKERGTEPKLLARFYESRFFADLNALNILPPTRILRVTEHIDEIIAFIAELIQSGAAYAAKTGNVYFAVQTSGDRYGQLEPSRSLANNNEGTPSAYVPATVSEKRDARDFALWKTNDPTSNFWDSPWGKGRPGWHIECSAMIMAALGPNLDLHTGGIDLRFPHHTNELATAEAKMCLHHLPVTKRGDVQRWCNTWLHAGHLHLKGHKMSKSLKNFVTIREFLEQGGTADGFRTFCLLHKYSSPLEYTEDRLADAQSYLARIHRFTTRHTLQDYFSTPDQVRFHSKCEHALTLEQEVLQVERDIEEALANDFNTPRALSKVAHLISVANSTLDKEGRCVSGAAALAYDYASRFVQKTLRTFGISDKSLTMRSESGNVSLLEGKMDRMASASVSFRSAIRQAAKRKDLGAIFEICDKSRDELRSEFGIHIADKKDGTSTWRKE